MTCIRMTLAILALLLLGAPAAPAGDLKEGDEAPDFKLVDEMGEEYMLDQFVGNQGVILAWFPRAFTPGCTAEIKSIRDNKTGIDKFNVACYMVSLDPPEKNAKFAEKYGCAFPVLSDPTGETAEAYGVGAPGAVFAKRWTYYIGEDGVIKHVDRSVKVGTHGEDIVAKLEELGFAKRPAAR